MAATNDVIRSFIFETMAHRLFDVTPVEEIAFGKMDLRLAHLLCRRFANNGLPLKTISTTHESLLGAWDRREVVSCLLGNSSTCVSSKPRAAASSSGTRTLSRSSNWQRAPALDGSRPAHRTSRVPRTGTIRGSESKVAEACRKIQRLRGPAGGSRQGCGGRIKTAAIVTVRPAANGAAAATTLPR
jgi:hypothetical protein